MSFKQLFLRVAIACSGLLAATATLAAPITLQTANNATGNQAWSGVGLLFHVNSAVKISALGIYDSGSDGISSGTTLSAYLFDSSNAVVASHIFFNGDASTLTSGYRFSSVGPITLGIGDYTLMGYGWNSQNPEHNCNISGVCENFNTGGGLLSYTTSAWTVSGSDTAGTLPTSFGATNYFSAANLQFEAVDAQVPEPSTVALFGLAIVGLGMARRKSV